MLGEGVQGVVDGLGGHRSETARTCSATWSAAMCGSACTTCSTASRCWVTRSPAVRSRRSTTLPPPRTHQLGSQARFLESIQDKRERCADCSAQHLAMASGAEGERWRSSPASGTRARPRDLRVPRHERRPTCRPSDWPLTGHRGTRTVPRPKGDALTSARAGLEGGVHGVAGDIRRGQLPRPGRDGRVAEPRAPRSSWWRWSANAQELLSAVASTSRTPC